MYVIIVVAFRNGRARLVYSSASVTSHHTRPRTRDRRHLVNKSHTVVTRTHTNTCDVRMASVTGNVIDSRTYVVA